MAKSVTTAATGLLQNLRRFIKKPWEITGPCASPEYRLAVPDATEVRFPSPASVKEVAIIPTSNPETVYDIKYFCRDQRRNRPPIKRTVLKKADVETMMKEATFNPAEFPLVYLTATVEKELDDDDADGGYQK